jgi:acetylornithine deacetylase/succinyl-diaminopimelate desuccinylase-like protein
MEEQTIAKKVADHVEKNRDAMIEFLRQVVSVPSIWGDVPQLARMANVLHAKLAASGVRASLPDSGTPGAPNVLGRVGNPSSGRRMLLCGHFDVYPPSRSWSFDPFSVPVRDGKVYGPGSTDMKGGTTAMIVAATVLAELGLPKGGEIVVLGVPNHFEGGEGTRRYLDGGEKHEAGIVCEPTDLDICSSQRGILYMNVHIKGVSAHSTAAHIGVNAIEKIVPLITELKKASFLKPGHDSYGPEKIVNVSMVKGGLRRCLIPETCDVTIDVRFSPSASAASVLADIQAILDNLHAVDPTFNASVEPEETCIRNPRSAMDWVNHPIVDAVSASHAVFAGKEATRACHPAWPDTPVMIEAGIPSITYGPGSKFCYWDDEYVSIEEYLQAIRVYATTAATWFEGRPQ